MVVVLNNYTKPIYTDFFFSDSLCIRQFKRIREGKIGRTSYER